MKWLEAKGCPSGPNGLLWYDWLVSLSRDQKPTWRVWWAQNAYSRWLRAEYRAGRGDGPMGHHEQRLVRMDAMLAQLAELGLELGYQPTQREITKHMGENPLRRLRVHYSTMANIMDAAGISDLPKAGPSVENDRVGNSYYLVDKATGAGYGPNYWEPPDYGISLSGPAFLASLRRVA